MNEILTKDIFDYVIGIRRHLHSNPELSFKEEKTACYISEKLEEKGYKVQKVAETGIITTFDSERPGPTLLLRADIDALPIQEENDVSYSSSVPGVMHACGHDGHTAMLLGVAAILPSIKDKICGKIILIFQPAEECPPGGAEKIIKSNLLPKVDGVIGAHLYNPLEIGTVGITTGPVMASVDRFTIDINGNGGHGAMPHLCIDPIIIGSQIINSLQLISSRKISPIEPFTLTVASFHSGSGFNIIPQNAVLTGTVRTHSEEVRNYVEQEMNSMVEGICKYFDAEGTVEYEKGYPVLINDKENTGFIQKCIVDYLGEENVKIMKPMTTSEDFSFYSSLGPLTYFFIGSGNKEKGFVNNHHNSKFDFDEDALLIGVNIFIKILTSLGCKNIEGII